MDTAAKRLMVTGASGFVGSHVVETLAKYGEYEIYALSTGRRKYNYPCGVTPVSADMLNYNETEYVIRDIKPEILISIAWDMRQPGAFKNNSIHADWLGANINLLKQFEKNGGKYFMHHSTGSEYHAYTGHCEVPKETKLSVYGEVKNALHKTAETYCLMNGIKFANTVCFNSIGERIRENTAVYAATKAFLEGKEFTCNAPYNISDFTFVGDTANAVVEVMRHDYEGSVNIGRGIPVLVGYVFKKIASMLNSEHLLKLNYDNVKFEAIVPNVDILNNEIGFVCGTALDESLQIVVDWIKRQGNM